MRDFCCPSEFICEHNLTFSKSLPLVILCLLSVLVLELVLETLSISSRHRTYSIKIEKPSESAATFQICFWYFMSFTMKSILLKKY